MRSPSWSSPCRTAWKRGTPARASRLPARTPHLAHHRWGGHPLLHRRGHQHCCCGWRGCGRRAHPSFRDRLKHALSPHVPAPCGVGNSQHFCERGPVSSPSAWGSSTSPSPVCMTNFTCDRSRKSYRFSATSKGGHDLMRIYVGWVQKKSRRSRRSNRVEIGQIVAVVAVVVVVVVVECMFHPCLAMPIDRIFATIGTAISSLSCFMSL